MAPPEPATPDVFKYDDFRLFLSDAFDTEKQRDRSFTHRKFAQRAGHKNPGYLNDVIKGYKPLSDNAAKQMAAGFNRTSKLKI
jgi:uncharacterized protein (TIGR02147 family)